MSDCCCQGRLGPQSGRAGSGYSGDYITSKNSTLTLGLVFVLGMSQQMVLQDDQVTGPLRSGEPGASCSKVHQHAEGKPMGQRPHLLHISSVLYPAAFEGNACLTVTLSAQRSQQV